MTPIHLPFPLGHVGGHALVPDGRIRPAATGDSGACDLIPGQTPNLYRARMGPNAPHFRLSEFLLSNTATNEGIDNTPPTLDILHNLTCLAECLELVRAALDDTPLIITSGYRCPALNTAVNGAKKSHHLQGLAADFIAPPLELSDTYARLAYREPADANMLAARNSIARLCLEPRWIHLVAETCPRPAGDELKTVCWIDRRVPARDYPVDLPNPKKKTTDDLPAAGSKRAKRILKNRAAVKATAPPPGFLFPPRSVQEQREQTIETNFGG